MSLKFVIIDMCFVSLGLLLFSSVECCIILYFEKSFKSYVGWGWSYWFLDGEFGEFVFSLDFIGIFWEFDKVSFLYELINYNIVLLLKFCGD